jgi:phosphoenolpyruvate carboxykinase (ATP)
MAPEKPFKIQQISDPGRITCGVDAGFHSFSPDCLPFRPSSPYPESQNVRSVDLTSYGLLVEDVHRNPPVPQLYADSIRADTRSVIAESGALIAYSGAKTGRSPLDKRVVRHADSQDDIWWGQINMPITQDTFLINRERAIDFLNTRSRLYCVDAFAGWDPATRVKVRVVCARPYHALFMYTMLIRPTAQELADYGDPDLVIINAGQFPANLHTTGMTSKTSVDLNLEAKEIVILGTEYAGEMKKGVFTYMNYAAPKAGILSMHCSATADRVSGQTSVMFGLSGTGKTTLSADPRRLLIGDDEHCWSDTGIYNIEGGCYAKAIFLSHDTEPEIFDALGYGSVLENVIYDKQTHGVDFTDDSITENTRGAYPIENVSNAKVPCIGDHPADVIFLTCDAFGVLPPVSRLTPEEAMYHFISGYTAKVAGTEVGVTEPEATFSPCFGGPFLAWHPKKYAQLLADRLREHGSNVWLVNTGWSGGAHGVGSRMKLSFTRAIINAIHEGRLIEAPTKIDPIFGFEVVTEVDDVPSQVLWPESTWADKGAYARAAAKLKGLFEDNYAQYR